MIIRLKHSQFGLKKYQSKSRRARQWAEGWAHLGCPF